MVPFSKAKDWPGSMMKQVAARAPAKAVLCAVQFEADFVGFEAPDSFLVGYGMDVAHKFRELPFVGMIQPEA